MELDEPESRQELYRAPVWMDYHSGRRQMSVYVGRLPLRNLPWWSKSPWTNPWPTAGTAVARRALVIFCLLMIWMFVA